MKYELMFLTEVDYGEFGKKENANVALIKRRTNTDYPEYAVVRNLDVSKPEENDCQWDNTICYKDITPKGLQECIDCYRDVTEGTYIPRQRLEELATNFKDYIFDIAMYERWQEESDVVKNIMKEYDMTNYEARFFGMIDDEKEEK